MRGKVTTFFAIVAIVGITPAYAGKSLLFLEIVVRLGDHPRVCGEKTLGKSVPSDAKGSPPRMRGKGKLDSGGLGECMDHPRVCGEKAASE